MTDESNLFSIKKFVISSENLHKVFIKIILNKVLFENEKICEASMGNVKVTKPEHKRLVEKIATRLESRGTTCPQQAQFLANEIVREFCVIGQISTQVVEKFFECPSPRQVAAA